MEPLLGIRGTIYGYSGKWRVLSKVEDKSVGVPVHETANELETAASAAALAAEAERRSSSLARARTILLLILLTVAGVLISGYHVGVEDQEVYLSAIQKNLDPSAYPFNDTFFAEQMKAALFVPAVAATARVLHSVEWALLLWHVLALFGILLACWKLVSACFESERARWAGMLLLTALLTMPIAGTALYPVDQYLNPRIPATCGILMAVSAALEKRWLRTMPWLIFAAAMHPLMALFGISLVVFVAWPAEFLPRRAGMLLAFMLPLRLLRPPSEAWREAVQARRYCFPMMWEWYEWLGLIVPVLLVWWFARIARRQGMEKLHHLASRLLAFAVFQFVVAMLMTVPAATEQLTAFQPMRWLHIFYFLFLLMAGGMLGQFVMRERSWYWLALIVPLAVGMFFAQRDLFKNSDHIEWPGAKLRNPWANAFLWVRANTPKSAVFAIPPKYMTLHEEEGYGFRALAERSMLAENQKDPGEVMVFPDLAAEWQRQVHAQKGIENFSSEQFAELKARYNVSWVVLPGSAKVAQPCPYQNSIVQVCRID